MDDFGLKPLDATNRHAFMEIIEDRHGKRATIIVSQLPTDVWHQVICEQTIADAGHPCYLGPERTRCSLHEY